MKKSRRIIKIVLIVVGVLLVVFVVASFMLINHFMKEYFNRSEQKKYSEYMRWADFEDFPRETVTFASGGETLTGYIYGKDKPAKEVSALSKSSADCTNPIQLSPVEAPLPVLS